MDVIRFWAWMLCSQNGVDHGRRWVLGMDALFLERMSSERMRPWTSFGFGHGCSVLRTDKTMDVIRSLGVGHGCSVVKPDQAMDVIRFWAWMFCCKNGLDHGRH